MDYEIQPDGGIRVGMAADLQGGFERTARAAEAPLRELAFVVQKMDGGWDGCRSPSDRTPQIQASLARKIVSPQRETTLRKEIERLAREESVRVLLDEKPAEIDTPFLQAVEEQSLQAHLQKLAERAGLVLAPGLEDLFILTTPEKAAELRAKEDAERTAYESSLDVLGKPLPAGGELSVEDFAESVQAALGVPVIPSEQAWNSGASISVSPGSPLRQGLDALKAQGLRWALLEGKLYIVK
jgi:hypothetical protein